MKNILILISSLISITIFSQQGNVGINTDSPTKTLDVNGDLRVRKIDVSQDSKDKILLADENGVVKNLERKNVIIPGVPKASVYQLETRQNNFLQSVAIGGRQNLPLSIVSENAVGVSYNVATNTFTFQPGLYTMTLTYEALHNAPNCTISSYYEDFPREGGIQRVHSTASHIQGTLASHGGNITFSFELTNPKTWTPTLGRGQSGNCIGAGMSLIENSTQLVIVSYDR